VSAATPSTIQNATDARSVSPAAARCAGSTNDRRGTTGVQPRLAGYRGRRHNAVARWSTGLKTEDITGCLALSYAFPKESMISVSGHLAR
jgi:hypothetical protein